MKIRAVKKENVTDKKDSVNIYIAAPMFSDADRKFNLSFKYILEDALEAVIPKTIVNIYLPQENNDINDKSKSATAIDIFYADAHRLDQTDILIASLDGLAIDPGVAAEIGYFIQKINFSNPKAKIFALSTDSRDFNKTYSPKKIEDINKAGICESQFAYQNLFVVGAVKAANYDDEIFLPINKDVTNNIYSNYNDLVRDVVEYIKQAY